MIVANLAILLVLNIAVALALYIIKGKPLLAGATWPDLVGSGLLLFIVTGAVPLVALMIARLAGRQGSRAIFAHYLLTIIIGATLSYGALTLRDSP